MPQRRTTVPASRGRIRKTVFSIIALLLLSGVPVSPGHMFGVPPDARVLVHPREIRMPDHLSGKAFVPARPRGVDLPFRKPATGISGGMAREPEFFPGGLDSLRFPDLRLPEGWTAKQDTCPEVLSPVSRRPDHRVSLKEEMVTLEDLDTGKPGGLSRWKDRPGEKLEGFLYIPTVWGEDYAPPIPSVRRDDREYFFSNPGAIGGCAIHLAEAVNRYTGLSARAGRNLFLSSPRILRMPFLFMTADRLFELTPTERENVGRYLSHGGFMFLDNAAPATEWGPGEASLKKMVRDALGSKARFQPIPRSHPVYHSVFDFEDGPPQGTENGGFNIEFDSARSSAGYYQGPNTRLSKPVFYLEGVFLGDELVAVYSNKGYSLRWSKTADNIPQLRMGVNLVVYALTREGGMNARNMARYRTGNDLPE